MVEIIPKKPAKEFPFINILLGIAGAVLLAVVLSYAIMVKSNAKTLSEVGNLEDGIAKLGTKEDKLIEEKVFNLEKKIKDFGALSGGMRQPSNFFKNFEELIHPQVWLSAISLDVPGAQVSVSGETSTFKTMEQQLIFLKSKEDLIDSFDLSNIAIGKDGGVEFNIDFNFKPEIFN